VSWQGNKALLPMRSNRAAIRTPPLPLPYKYHPTPAHMRGKTNRRDIKKKRKEMGGKEKESR